MNISRRDFIKSIPIASAMLIEACTHESKIIDVEEVIQCRGKVKLRFVVASDGHYGQPNTDYVGNFNNLTNQVNAFHLENCVDFCVINGDITHDNVKFMPPAKRSLDNFIMPYYVVRGNHDIATDEYWKEVWKMPLNHDVVVKKNNAILLGDTSNIWGMYMSPDLAWMKSTLDKYRKLDNVFIFIHIPQKWTAHATNTPAFFDLLQKYPNIRAVFHGHEHDQDGVLMSGRIPFLFNSRIGGDWGTNYKGFRVVEVLNDDSILTYIMNPTQKINELIYT
jgi:DNA repair exonuclease SbcCD nuclease subunit